jgi:hypothetical protein
MNTIAYAILRPLHPDLPLDSNDGASVKATVLTHCELDTELMERHLATWSSADEFCAMAFVGPLNSARALLPLLLSADEPARVLFPRICRLMRTVAVRMPVAKLVMKGWQAALLARSVDIPGPARAYFENLGVGRDELKNVPTDLIVTNVPSAEEDELAEKWDDGELEFLLNKLGSMSVE